jgi:hypothetical protein
MSSKAAVEYQILYNLPEIQLFQLKKQGIRRQYVYNPIP